MKQITKLCVLAAVILTTSSTSALAESVGGPLEAVRIDKNGLHVWFPDNWKKCGSSREFHYEIHAGQFERFVKLVTDSIINRYQVKIDFVCYNNQHFIKNITKRY